MENIIRYPEMRQNTFALEQIAIGDLTDAIVETVEAAGHPASQQEKLREQLREMFRNSTGMYDQYPLLTRNHRRRFLTACKPLSFAV